MLRHLISRLISSRLTVAAISCAATAAFLAGAVYASIPGPGGIINGCYQQSTGKLRVIDSAATCLPDEVALNWNQIGPPGPTGPPGPPGITLWASVAAEGTLLGGTATAAVRDGPGQYQVFFGRDVSNCAPVASAEGSGNIASATPLMAPAQRQVLVFMDNFNVGTIDDRFHLVVAC